MAIPNFFQQQQQSLQTGLNLGGAMQEAQRNALLNPMKANLLQSQTEGQGIQNQLNQERIAGQQTQTQLGQARIAGQQQRTENEENENKIKGFRQDIGMLFAYNDDPEVYEKALSQIAPKYANDPIIGPFIEKLATEKDATKRNSALLGMMGALNPDQQDKDTRTPGIKEFEYYEKLKLTDPKIAEEFGKANDILDDSGAVILKTSDINTINKGVSQLTNEYKAVRSSAKELDKLGKMESAPAQMAMLFKFLKALDPASTVRESEYASAANTTGVPERIMNMYNKAATGEMLNKKQVDEFVNVSKTLANSKGEEIRSTVSDYLDTYDIKKSRKERFMNTAKVVPFKIKQINSTKEMTQAEYDILPAGAEYTVKGVTYIKGK